MDSAKKCNQVGTIIMCALLHYQPGNINSSKWKTNFFLHYTVMQAYWDEVISRENTEALTFKKLLPLYIYILYL